MRPLPMALCALLPLTAAAGEPPLPRARPDMPPPVIASGAASPAIVADGAPPERNNQLSCPAVFAGAITATTLPPIHQGQCGIATPLAVSALTVNGHSVALDAPATLDCALASALPGWIGDVDAFATATMGTVIAGIAVGTAYACRNVDNAPTGKLSFHAFGAALDVMGFRLADGRTITVAAGWHGGADAGAALVHYAHDAACARFTTVLGPEADSFHQDHVHVDLACHGRACTARLCQ